MPEFLLAVMAGTLLVGGSAMYLQAHGRDQRNRALASSHPGAGALPGDSIPMIEAKNAAYEKATYLAHLLQLVAIHDDNVSSVPEKLRADIDAALRDFYPHHGS